jgi:hypothetical protein
MDIEKLKVGKTVNYKVSRGNNSGRGRIESIDHTPTGVWVTVHDKTAKKSLVLRPGNLSQ